MKVLFVDDDPVNRTVMREMLKIESIEMDEAGDAATGIRMIESTEYAVVLMDLRMPGMDGLQALNAIRARHDAKSRVPVVIVTADTAPGLLAECLREGADDFLTKPVTLDALFNAVARLGGLGGAADAEGPAVYPLS